MNKSEFKKRLLDIKKEKGDYGKYDLNTGHRFNAVGISDGINMALELLDQLDEKEDSLYLINLGDNQYARKFNKTKIDSLLVIKEDAAEFTEQEIKAIDERYWAFAEPVE